MLQKVHALYGAGEYQQALELSARCQTGSADEAGELAYMRLRLFTRLGQSDLALAALRQSLGAGYWYSPTMLRRDQELLPLRGLPAFEQLIALCDERRAEAQKAAAPARLTVVPPAPPSGPPPLLLALHGNISSVQLEKEQWSPFADRGWTVSMPQSSQVGAPERYVWSDREWAVREVQMHLRQLRAAYAIDPGRVVVGGLSVGAGLAIWLGLSGLLGARGFIAVAPWLINPAELRPLLEAGAPEGLRGYIIVGDNDPYPFGVSQEVKALLANFGIACELEVHPGLGHGYPEEFTPSLDRAIRFIEGEVR